MKRLSLTFLGLCLAGTARAGAPPLRVASLFTVLTEIATEIGGPDTVVTGVLKPGVDPHTFEPSPSDVQVIADSDLVLASGLGLESYLNRVTLNSGTRARIVDAGDAFGGDVITIEERGSREPDPHWWNSVAAARRVVAYVADQMAALRPDSSIAIHARAAAYSARLGRLDDWTRAEIARIPPEHRRLVTTHDAFGWFAHEYGFAIEPISGLSTESEPDARHFAQLIDLVRRERIPAVFIENTENSKLSATLARETGARLGGTLYADGLAPEADGATYEAMFRHNVLAIVEALR